MEGRFTRLFGDLQAVQFDEDDLTELATVMTADPEPKPSPETEDDGEENSGITSAYTCLGQLIDHDLTLDPTSHLRRRVTPEKLKDLVDFRTPRFDRFMAVEKYSHVMHIVFNVSGTLREGVPAMDALRRCCPRERCRARRRSARCRSSMSSSRSSAAATAARSATCPTPATFDIAIHIRTVVITDGRAHVQAGGGTVADSRPDYEFAESGPRRARSCAAVELASQQRGWANEGVHGAPARRAVDSWPVDYTGIGSGLRQLAKMCSASAVPLW